MTTKCTHGPCTCGAKERTSDGRLKYPVTAAQGCDPDCPSLYPAQQEPDALTRLVRHVRTVHDISHVPQTATQVAMARDQWTEQALAIISEAREEQRRAVVHAENNGLERARKMASFEGLEHLASLFEAAKKVTP